jgi:hypothetical protein
MVFVPPKDRVIEHSTSNSQTVFAVTGAIDASFNPFSASMSIGDTTIGGVVEPGTAFACGKLTYSNTNEVTIDSTGYASKGTFSSSGIKEVFMGLPAEFAGPPVGYAAPGAAFAPSSAQQAQARTNIAAAASGFLNRLRNSSLTSWFHGTGVTITTAGGWGAEGVYVVPSGASVGAVQGTPPTFSGGINSMFIAGATSVTGVVVRFVVESFDAAPLAGRQVTFQLPVANSTGGTITPTITVKRANSLDASYTNVDVSAVSLQSIADNASGVLSYSWTTNAGSFNGLSIDIDFGNNFSSFAKTIQIGAGFDLRVTPGVATGLVSNPPVPEIRDAVSDIAWNQRFFETSFSNNTAPGTATHTDITSVAATSDGTATGSGGISFRVPKRAVPNMNFWDGAGHANKFSTRTNGSWSDNGGASPAFVVVGLNGAVFDTSSSSTADFFIHWAADATLTGA